MKSYVITVSAWFVLVLVVLASTFFNECSAADPHDPTDPHTSVLYNTWTEYQKGHYDASYNLSQSCLSLTPTLVIFKDPIFLTEYSILCMPAQREVVDQFIKEYTAAQEAANVR